MSRYYASPNGMTLMRSGGILPPPEDWTEITREEFHGRLAEHGQDLAAQPVRLLSEVQAEQAAATSRTAAPKAKAAAKPKR